MVKLETSLCCLDGCVIVVSLYKAAGEPVGETQDES